MSIKLDELDKKILNILQNNADLGYSELAKMLNVSPSTIYLRIKKLKDLGIIKRIIALVDYTKLGYEIIAYVFVKADPQKYNQVLSKIVNIQEVIEVHDVTGAYYCIAKVIAKNTSDLARILDIIGSIEGVIATETCIVMRVVKEYQGIPL